jgi:hypothetical protein
VAAELAIPSAISQYLCEYFNLTRHIPYYKRVVISELLVSCVLPLCVTAFTYIITARHLVERYQSISEEAQNPQINTSRKVQILWWDFLLFFRSAEPYHALWTYIICTAKPKISAFTIIKIVPDKISHL